ncbi:MAG: hypothetical protein DRJ05_04835 [Bacteroidetes bacterium]|nr:MAG: hypothetical protein DRJ05_04835 [Bacteroidota bacterium]
MTTLKKQAPVLYKIAEFITSVNPKSISHETVHQTKRVIADTMGTAYSGIKSDAYKIASRSFQDIYSSGKCNVWGTDLHLNAFGAVFFNALAISSTDFDEGHRSAVGHPASLVVPVALALRDDNDISYEEIIISIIIGYEVGTRFSNARIKEKITTYSSGRWGAIGSAATASFLLGLNIEQTMHALSLAAILSPTMLGGSTDVSTGSMAKEGVAWASLIGLQSAVSAKEGFIGPYLFVDDHDDYDKKKLLENLENSWLIDTNYFKPYACCRWLHSAIEAGLILKKDSNIEFDSIKSIEVEIFTRAINLIGATYPGNSIQAQFHLPYCLATALSNNKLLPEYFDKNHLKMEEINDLIKRISLMPSDKYDNIFPEKLPSKVSITLSNGKTYSKEIVVAPWDAINQPTDEELFEKFMNQTGEKGQKLWKTIFE